MSKYEEKRIAFVDVLNCRDQSDPSKPHYEGKIKVTKNGKEYFVKLWKKPKPGVTGNFMFTGYMYDLVEKEIINE